MTVSAAKYLVPFASERLLPRTSRGTFNGCRLSSAWMGTALASLGESATAPDGSPKGPRGRGDDLADMRKATGEPDRDGFNTSHVPAIHQALGYPTPDSWEGTFEQLWDDPAGFAIAGDPSDIRGASTLEHLAASRGWSGASHEMLLLPKRTATHGWVMDPMRPQGAYHGDKVPKAEIRQFMRSPELQNGGRIVAERYVPGDWTAEARTARRLRSRLEDQAIEAEAERKRLKLRIAALEAGGTDCADPIAAAVERERVTIRDLVDARRSLGPE